jgi:hypothetical protein
MVKIWASIKPPAINDRECSFAQIRLGKPATMARPLIHEK